MHHFLSAPLSSLRTHQSILIASACIHSAGSRGARGVRWARGVILPSDFGEKENRGCDTFGPKRIWSSDIWSPKIGPQLIGPSEQTFPNQFSPHGPIVPKNRSPWKNGPQPIWSPYFQIPTACSPGQMKYSRDHLSRGTKLVGDHFSMVTKF